MSNLKSKEQGKGLGRSPPGQFNSGTATLQHKLGMPKYFDHPNPIVPCEERDRPIFRHNYGDGVFLIAHKLRRRLVARSTQFRERLRSRLDVFEGLCHGDECRIAVFAGDVCFDLCAKAKNFEVLSDKGGSVCCGQFGYELERLACLDCLFWLIKEYLNRLLFFGLFFQLSSFRESLFSILKISFHSLIISARKGEAVSVDQSV